MGNPIPRKPPNPLSEVPMLVDGEKNVEVEVSQAIVLDTHLMIIPVAGALSHDNQSMVIRVNEGIP